VPGSPELPAGGLIGSTADPAIEELRAVRRYHAARGSHGVRRIRP
jgi:hypothetical protein